MLNRVICCKHKHFEHVYIHNLTYAFVMNLKKHLIDCRQEM